MLPRRKQCKICKTLPLESTERLFLFLNGSMNIYEDSSQMNYEKMHLVMCVGVVAILSKDVSH